MDVALGGERRTVTVLRAEILGSAALQAGVDTEEWALTLSALLRSLGETVHRYGGSVDRYLERGLEACFGAATAHEDDPERAVLAALDMHEAFAAVLATLVTQARQAAAQSKLGLSVGVHTGQAIVTLLEAEGGGMAIGETLTVAAQTQSLAERGQVRVSASTHRLVAPLFEWASRDPANSEDEANARRPLRHRDRAGKGPQKLLHGCRPFVLGTRTNWPWSDTRNSFQ